MISGTDLKGLESFKQSETAAHVSKSIPGLCFYGQLTDTGKSNMMALGSKLRFYYINQLELMGQTLVPQSLYIRSTDYLRTIESVQYLLGGLYPRKNRFEEQDLEIHVRDYKEETMIPPTNCPSLLSDTLKRKNELQEQVKEDAKRAFAQIKHLGNSRSKSYYIARRNYNNFRFTKVVFFFALQTSFSHNLF